MLFKTSNAESEPKVTPERSGVIAGARRFGHMVVKLARPGRIQGAYPVFNGPIPVVPPKTNVEPSYGKDSTDVTRDLRASLKNFIDYETEAIASPGYPDPIARQKRVTEACRVINAFTEAFGVDRSDIATKTRVAMAIDSWLVKGESPFSKVKGSEPGLNPVRLLALAEKKFDPASLQPTEAVWNQMAEVSGVQSPWVAAEAEVLPVNFSEAA